MQLVVDKVYNQAVITHDDQQMVFNLKVYCEGKNAVKRLHTKDHFRTLQLFLNQCSKQQQNELWLFYVNCKNILDGYLDLDEITDKLKDEIGRISLVFSVEQAEDWYGIRSGIPMPVDMMYSLNDLPERIFATKDQTYLVKDYVGLCGLALIMTMLAPVLSEYAEKTKSSYGNSWRHYYTYLLLERSTYFTCNPLNRLRTYVSVTVDAHAEGFDTVILSGMSSDEYIEWVTSNVLIKRVACGDISGDPDSHSLIKLIHKQIVQRITAMNNDFHGSIGNRPDTVVSSEDNKPSLYEQHGSRQDVLDNHIVASQWYLRNIHQAVRKLDPSVPDEIINESMSNMDYLYQGVIHDGPLTLLKWVINDIVYAKMMERVDRDTIINAMVIARAVLWHQKRYDLAALVCALPIDNEEMHMVTGSERRSRVYPDLVERIDTYFPYYLKPSAQKKFKPTKSVMVSAMALEELFNQHDWHLTLPESWIKSGNLEVMSRHYHVQDEIRLSLIDLACDIASKPSKQ